MIFTETAVREVREIRQHNQDRIEKFGVCPLCEKCLWSCKVGNAEGLINFWCIYFEEK